MSNEQMSESELTDRIQKVGMAVYDKIHFGVPFQQPVPSPGTYTSQDALIQQARPFAMARIGVLLVQVPTLLV